MKIFSASGVEILDVIVEDNSYRYRSIMSDDTLIIKFSATEPISLPVGSYTEYQGVRYTLWYPENFKKHNSRNFEYTLVLHSWREALKLYLYKDLSAKPYRVKFPLVATPDVFIQLLVDVLNMNDSGWIKGNVISSDEKLINFNHENCYDALNRIAQEFDTEWEIINKTIHLRRVEKFKDDPLPLSYGKGNGFVSGVGRVNDGDRQPIGRMYVEGGERNIDFSKYGSNTLLLPKSASLLHNGKTYETDEDGMYIFRVGNNNKAEGSYDGSKFYPKRVGAVSSVEVIDEEQHFYDIIDLSIPEALNYQECRIAGEKATIIFQSGVLAGREFDIEQTDEELTGYIHDERRFKIVPAEYDGYVMPGGLFAPKPGDKYAIFNISMPEAYIRDDATMTGASWDMFKESVAVFAREEEQKFTFTGQIDGIWSKSLWLEIGSKIVPGGHILFSDEQFLPNGSVIRITGVKDYVNKPHKPEMTLSNASMAPSLGSVIDDLETDEVIIDESKKEAIRFTKRRWRDTKETMSMLKKSLLNFSDSINPIAIQTMQLLVGDESLQFRFVNSKTAPSVIEHVVDFDIETKLFTANAGTIQHMTLGINEIKDSHKPSDYKFWDMAAYESPALEQEKSYYLYAKCVIAGNTGQFILSESAIKMNAVPSHYHFLVGILNSEFDDVRSYVQMYGFTEILPGRITTDKIVSADGRTYFDLVNSIIGGKLRFLSNGIEKDLADWADSILNNLDNTDQTITDLEDYLNEAFRDGLIEEAEAKAIETYINQIQSEKAGVEATYNKLYINPILQGTAKTNLLNSKISYFGAVDSLTSSINAVIADGRVTTSEKQSINAIFNTYKSSLATFSTRIEEAKQFIEQAIKSVADDAKSIANAASSAVAAVTNSVNNISNTVNNLDSYIDNAFHDGVIEEVEAKVIESYINQILVEKASLEATYNKLYLNHFLTGTPKTNLLNAKISFFGAVDDLTASINAVIADGKVTPSEKQSINVIFGTYRSALASFATRIEEANASIQTKINDNITAIDASINIIKAITDKFGTTVDGGLISTVMMLLREANSETVTSGLSGIQSATQDAPSYWSGGTHIQAHNFVPFVRKLESGQSTTLGEYNDLPKVVFLHDGSAKLGHFIGLKSGEVLMIDPSTGAPRLRFTNEKLKPISDLVSGANTSGSTAVGAGATSFYSAPVSSTPVVVSSQVVSGSTSVAKSSSVGTFNGTQLYISATGKKQANGMASYARAILYLRRAGVRISQLATVSVDFLDGVYTNKYNSSAVIKNYHSLYPGTHTFELVIEIAGDVTSGNASSSASNFSWAHTVAGIREQQYANDGMMFFYSNRHFYYNELTGFDVKESDPSRFNLPGVLLSGSVNSAGGFAGWWGSKKHSSLTATRQSAGAYAVYHSVGHTNYQVSITPSSNRTFYVSSKNTSYFIVYFYTNASSPSLSDTSFDFQITGNNYA